MRMVGITVEYTMSQMNRANNYGLSINDVANILLYQNNECPICLNVFDSTWVIEHNHNTGLVRGIVHHRCNNYISIIEHGKPLSDKTIEQRVRQYIGITDTGEKTLYYYVGYTPQQVTMKMMVEASQQAGLQ